MQEFFQVDPKDPAILELGTQTDAKILTADSGRDGGGFGNRAIVVPGRAFSRSGPGGVSFDLLERLFLDAGVRKG